MISVKDSGKEDTTAEMEMVKNAEEKVKSATDNVMATQKKLDVKKAVEFKYKKTKKLIVDYI